MGLEYASLFLIGLSGERLTPLEKEAIKALGLRHFIFFSRNFIDHQQWQSLLSGLKSLTSLRFLAVDQEGGPVVRLKPPLFPPLRAPLSLAQSKNPELVVKDEASFCASYLKALGLNLNLAPVLDLAGEESPSFLRERTFGADPEKVAFLGSVYIRVFLGQKVLCCAKHFPGLGEVTMDPHLDLPVQKGLSSKALLPFEVAVKSGVPAIMTSHLLIQELDQEPATFSEKLVSLVRKELSFKGLLLTDDLFMGAVTKRNSLDEAVVKAFEAGYDLLLLCQDFEKAVKVIEELYPYFQSKTAQKRIKEINLRQMKALSLVTKPYYFS